MTLQQLVFFTAIHQYGSFTTAANELFISQSSLSKQIISLEKELGIELFVRNTRHICLSEAGEQILPHVLSIVGKYQEMKNCAALVEQSAQGVIKLGGVPVLSIYGITHALLKFETLHPEFSVEIAETKTSYILSRLAACSLDIGIVRLAYPLEYDSGSMLVIPLVDDEQVLVTSSDHPFVRRERISLAEAMGETFVQLNSDPVVAAHHIQQIELMLPDVTLHLSNMKMDSIKQCILQKGWVSLMMREVAQAAFLPEAHIVLLQEPLRLTLCAVLRREDPNPACQALISFLTTYFRKKTIYPQSF
ncbi:LysR family transcriptional regulator [Marasmitruncus massiliensis]|uniref:LysR family transcriptional regulator n=1 Tax=Marasmitruncus massiliensis TaxID=1944642 RepID=UPI0015E11EF8|nr:LysR family transcriptional regulator [Marasmitruncus massiliensis]